MTMTAALEETADAFSRFSSSEMKDRKEEMRWERQWERAKGRRNQHEKM